jgi:hypothetical protein
MTPKRPGVHIGRLDLDLRGIAPATAEAAAHQLKPALERALSGMPSRPRTAERIDAGRISVAAKPTAQTVADQIASRVARSLRGPKS